MKKWSDTTWNFILYAGKEAAFNAMLPFVTGTLIQLFLAHKGVVAERIGLFNTVIYIVNIAATILLSGTAERQPNAVRQCNRPMLMQSLLYFCYLPAVFCADSATVFWIILPAAIVQTLLYACKSIYEYKLLYQIVDISQYGAITSFTGIAIGIAGIITSWICARLIAAGQGELPYLVGMVITGVMLFAAYVCNKSLRIVNHSFDTAAPKAMGVGQVWALLRSPVFMYFAIPNILRGITLGVTNSIALIALGMGLSEGTTATLATMCAMGYVVGSFLYYILEKRIRETGAGIMGAVLLCTIVLLPEGNSGWFLGLFLIAYIGRILVDYSIPVLVVHMIDPETAGTYNAWRGILSNLAAAITAYAVGALIGKVNPLVLLIPCAAGYGICMIWYCVLYRRFHRAHIM